MNSFYKQIQNILPNFNVISDTMDYDVLLFELQQFFKSRILTEQEQQQLQKILPKELCDAWFDPWTPIEAKNIYDLERFIHAQEYNFTLSFQPTLHEYDLYSDSFDRLISNRPHIKNSAYLWNSWDPDDLKHKIILDLKNQQQYIHFLTREHYPIDIQNTYARILGSIFEDLILNKIPYTQHHQNVVLQGIIQEISHSDFNLEAFVDSVNPELWALERFVFLHFNFDEQLAYSIFNKVSHLTHFTLPRTIKQDMFFSSEKKDIWDLSLAAPIVESSDWINVVRILDNLIQEKMQEQHEIILAHPSFISVLCWVLTHPNCVSHSEHVTPLIHKAYEKMHLASHMINYLIGDLDYFQTSFKQKRFFTYFIIKHLKNYENETFMEYIKYLLNFENNLNDENQAMMYLWMNHATHHESIKLLFSNYEQNNNLLSLIWNIKTNDVHPNTNMTETSLYL